MRLPLLRTKKQSSRFGKFLIRAVVAVFVWVLMGALALASAIPYGGGDKTLITLWTLSSFALPVWVIAALFGGDVTKASGPNTPDSGADRRCPFCNKITPADYDDCIWCHELVSSANSSTGAMPQTKTTRRKVVRHDDSHRFSPFLELSDIQPERVAKCPIKR